MPLLNIAANLQADRQLLFDMPVPFQMNKSRFDELWPYIDNIWYKQEEGLKKANMSSLEPLDRHPYSVTRLTCKMARRLGHEYTSMKGQETVSKRRRLEGGNCSCRVKARLYSGFNNQPDFYLFEHSSKKEEDWTHTHTLDQSDYRATNSFLRQSACVEASKGYSPAAIFPNFRDINDDTLSTDKALHEAGGKFLTRQKIADFCAAYRKQHPSSKKATECQKGDVEAQIRDFQLKCESHGYEHELIRVDSVDDAPASIFEDNPPSSAFASTQSALPPSTANTAISGLGVVFWKAHRLLKLVRHGHLSLIDSTHGTCELGWKLFTIMCRDEFGIQQPVVHGFLSNETGELIAEMLSVIKNASAKAGGWKLQHVLSDDSAAEQKAFKLAFKGLAAGETEIDHLLCRVHSERTLQRKLAHAQKFKKHPISALKYRRTQPGCIDSINAAIKDAPNITTRKYIERYWLKTRRSWANLDESTRLY